VAGHTSPVPRSAPISTPCMPSGSSASPPIMITGIAITVTAGSLLYAAASVAGAVTNNTAQPS